MEFEWSEFYILLTLLLHRVELGTNENSILIQCKGNQIDEQIKQLEPPEAKINQLQLCSEENQLCLEPNKKVSESIETKSCSSLFQVLA